MRNLKFYNISDALTITFIDKNSVDGVINDLNGFIDKHIKTKVKPYVDKIIEFDVNDIHDYPKEVLNQIIRRRVRDINDNIVTEYYSYTSGKFLSDTSYGYDPTLVGHMHPASSFMDILKAVNDTNYNYVVLMYYEVENE